MARGEGVLVCSYAPTISAAAWRSRCSAAANGAAEARLRLLVDVGTVPEIASNPLWDATAAPAEREVAPDETRP